MPYEFRKVYIDLITEAGEVCVVYLSFVRFFQKWHAQASCEIYDPSGQRSIVHATDAPPLIDPGRGLDQLPGALLIPGGRIELDIQPIHDAWQPVAPCPVPELQWSIGALRANTTVTITTEKEGARTLRGEGYVDFVRITKATRKLGLRSLRWGRVHMFERSLAYTALDLADDRRWYVGVTRLHGRPARAYGNLTIALEGGEGMVRFGTGGQVLRLKKARVLHEGSPFDPERVPSALHRQVCNLVSGPMHERRWFAEATVDASHGRGKALHEIVWFGPAARKAAAGTLKG
jgi:hypothetical protein